MREALAAPARLLEQRGDTPPRLREEGQLPGRRIHVREAGVQSDTLRDQAQAVGAADAQQVRVRGIQLGLLLRRPEASGQRHGRVRVAPPSAAIKSGTVCGGVQMTASLGASGNAATST